MYLKQSVNLEQGSWQRLPGGSSVGGWTFLAVLCLKMPGAGGHRPRVVIKSRPLPGLECPPRWLRSPGVHCMTACSLGPLPPPDQQVMRRGAEVLALLSSSQLSSQSCRPRGTLRTDAPESHTPPDTPAVACPTVQPQSARREGQPF